MTSAARFDTLTQLARAAHLSVRTVEDLTAGRRSSYRDSTLRAIEAALGWERGDAQRVVQGAQPRRLPDHGLGQIVDAWPRLSERDRAVMLAVLEALRR